MINFGTIFRFKELYYIYLVQTDDVLYAAKILDKELTKQLVRSRDSKSRSSINKTHEKPLYCFVILHTNQFKDQAAHYGSPDMATDLDMEVISMLNEEDVKSLKNEISCDIAANKNLKKLVSEMLN